MICFILVLFGFFLLVKGSDFLVDGSSDIAKRLNIPTIVIGMTIVAIGTSLPELIVSTKAAIENHSDIAIGNIVGSNITNLLLILGLCAIIKPLIFTKETIKYENIFMIFTTFLLSFLGINCVEGKMNMITRSEGILLLSFAFLFIIYNLYMAIHKNNDTKIERDSKRKNILFSISGIIIGIISLKIGGDLVVDNVSLIASYLGISEKIISLTLVAFSTSLPELITSVSATRRGEIEMAIGNIIGSNIFNILLIIGLAAFINPIQYASSYNKDMLLLLFSTIIFSIYPLIGEKKKMTRKEGILFLVIYLFYVISLVY